MKCSDISDERFIAAVDIVIRIRGAGCCAYTAARWDVAAVLDGHPEWIGQPEALDGESVRLPQKLVLAKARKLIRRGLLNGCACGCRGDLERKRIVPAALKPALLDPRSLFALEHDWLMMFGPNVPRTGAPGV